MPRRGDDLIAEVAGYARVFESLDEIEYGSGSATDNCPGGMQNLVFTVATLTDNACRVDGAVTVLK